MNRRRAKLILAMLMLLLMCNACSSNTSYVNDVDSDVNSNIIISDNNLSEILLQKINMVEAISCDGDKIIVSGNTDENIKNLVFDSLINILDIDGNILEEIKVNLTKNQSILAIDMYDNNIWCLIDDYGDFNGETIADIKYSLIRLNHEGNIEKEVTIDFNIPDDEIVDINSFIIGSNGKIYILQGKRELLIYDTSDSKLEQEPVDFGSLDVDDEGNIYAINDSGEITYITSQTQKDVFDTKLVMLPDSYQIIAANTIIVKNGSDLYWISDFNTVPKQVFSLGDSDLTGDGIAEIKFLNDSSVLIHTYNKDYISKLSIISLD